MTSTTNRARWVAKETKLVKLGRIELDGIKVKANASKHRALSHRHIGRIAAQLHEEVQQLMGMAENADRNGVPDGMDVPAEIARREARLKALSEANAKIEARPRNGSSSTCIFPKARCMPICVIAAYQWAYEPPGPATSHRATQNDSRWQYLQDVTDLLHIQGFLYHLHKS